MNIHEAIKLLKEGKLIRRPSHKENMVFLIFVNETLGIKVFGEIDVKDKDESYYGVHRTAYFSIEDVEATDWEVFTPSR